MEKWNIKLLREKQEIMDKKVQACKNLLAGVSWRHPEGKEDFVNAVYGDNVPKYLFYDFGQKGVFIETDLNMLVAQFWSGSSQCSLTVRRVEEGHPFGPFVLCVRNARKFLAEITVDGVVCPLVQAGYFNKSFFDIFGFNCSDEEPCAIFPYLYG